MTFEQIHDKYPHMTVRQLTIMSHINSGLIFTTRIASRMEMFASVISRNVKSLEGIGLLTRTEERDKKNCRKWRLKLTPAGRKVMTHL